jgi:hypothetical protein
MATRPSDPNPSSPGEAPRRGRAMSRGKKGTAKRKLKAVSYRFIKPDSDAGERMYALLRDLILRHHEDLKDARIALAWNTSWQPDVDGRCVLGKLQKVSDLDRELLDGAFDFVIILRQEFWQDPRVTEVQRRALLDHELCHAAVKVDTDLEPVIDECNRVVYRTRKHDLEEFACIAERYGLWKRDLEIFDQAVTRAKERQGNYFVGVTTVRERLIAAGADVPVEAITGWSEPERREADVWARVVIYLKERDLDAVEAEMPAHVVAALPVTRQDSEGVVAASTAH